MKAARSRNAAPTRIDWGPYAAFTLPLYGVDGSGSPSPPLLGGEVGGVCPRLASHRAAVNGRDAHELSMYLPKGCASCSVAYMPDLISGQPVVVQPLRASKSS